MRYFGAHVSSAGGHQNAIKAAEKFQINSIQTMPSAPMRWATKEIPEEQIEAFVNEQKNSVVKKLLVHGIYLINLARKDKKLFHLSKMSLATYMNYLHNLRKAINENGNELDLLGATFHPGSAKDLTPEKGIERISYGIDWIFENSEGNEMLLLETSAGAGEIMGDTLGELTAMREGVKQKDRVGYVLDTQHMWASGYDWKNDLEGVVKKIDNELGLENVKCIHLNDSMPELGSHKDRHANLGKGEIGIDTIKRIVNHSKLKKIPFILETPALKEEKSMGEEIKKLEKLID